MYKMKRYTSAQARQRFADVLDEAERGEAVVIERRGVRFRLEAERSASRSFKGKQLIRPLDPAVARGEWTWEWEPGKLTFLSVGRRRRSRG